MTSNPHVEPDDLALIAADDELLDQLAAGLRPDDGDDVTQLLVAWRDDLGAARPALRPATPAVATRDAARPRRRPLRRSTRILLGAAAAVAVIAAGTALAARDAGPGSPLWPVARLLYPEHASSAVAEQEVQTALDEAQAAIEAGDPAQAQRLLETAQALLDEVTDPEAAARLRAQLQALLAAVLPTGIVPTGILPTGILPTGVVPTGILPTGVVPTGIVPTGILPTEILPSGGILPSGVLPSGLLPSCVLIVCL